MSTAPRKNNQGIALILALLFITLMTVLVVEFAYEMQVEATLATNQSSDFETYIAAKSAIALGMSLIEEDFRDDEEAGIFFDGPWDPINWYNGVPFEALNQAVMRCTIVDEYGKINLNALLMPQNENQTANTTTGSGTNTSTATTGATTFAGTDEPRPELYGILTELFNNRLDLFSEVGITFEVELPPEAYVDSILDWLDGRMDPEGDTDRYENDGGGESDFYADSDIPYGAKNGPMDAIEELLLVNGFTPEFYFGVPEEDIPPLSDLLTVHGDWAGRININTTPEEILLAIADYAEMSGTFSSFDADQIQDIRSEEPGFETLDDLAPFVAGVAPPNTQPPTAARGRRTAVDPNDPPPQGPAIHERLFTVSSNVFRLYGDAMLGDTLIRIESYVWRTPDPRFFEEEFITPVLEELPAIGEELPLERLRVLNWKVIR
jgi:general secretion pathway protein K